MPPASRLQVYVDARAAGQRLDQYLQAALAPISRNQLKRLLDRGLIRSRGRVERLAGRPLQPGELLEVQGIDVEVPAAQLDPDRIRFFDGQLLALDKPAGLGMHAVEKGDTHHLVAAVQTWAAERRELIEPGAPFIVSRLDKETSGLVLFGWTKEAGRRLTALFADRAVHKVDRALVHGQPPEEGEIDAAIDAVGDGRYGVSRSGKPARTRFKVLTRGDQEAALEVFPETGRSHQIRVHLASIGHPLVGDLLYGGRWREGVRRCMLHAERLELDHPMTGEPLRLEAPVPALFTPR